MNNLDVMVSRPNIDILQNILELIQRIMEEAVKYTLKTETMVQFIRNTKTIMDDTTINELKYPKLSEEATILRSSLDFENKPVLRYRKS